MLGSKTFEEATTNMNLMKAFDLLDSVNEIEFVHFKCSKHQLETL